MSGYRHYECPVGHITLSAATLLWCPSCHEPAAPLPGEPPAARARVYLFGGDS